MTGMKIELVILRVGDVDRAVAFYRDRLGFVLDVDVRPTPGLRVVQLTPPGSACSVGFGSGAPVYDDAPAARSLHLVVPDIEAARRDLTARGVEVGRIVDVGGGVRYASIEDPDGNTLALQEMPWRTGADF